MSDNLVDTMMEEMGRTNSADVLNYQPHMSQPSPIQAHSDPRMGEIQYAPPDMDMTGGMPSYPMRQPIAGQQPMMDQQMAAQQQVMPPATSQQMMMVDDEGAPDFTSYGMEEDSGFNSLLGLNFNDLKDVMIVIALAVILSLPQINRPIRNNLARFVQNPLYLSILQAVILGVLFYVVRLFL